MEFFNIVYRAEKNVKFFLNDEDYKVYWLELLKSLKKYNGKALAVGLMSNHVHLFVRLDTANLNNFIKSVFAKQRYYLQKEGRVKRGERFTERKSVFAQIFAEKNMKGIRSNIIYVNRNYCKVHRNVDLETHLSSAIPFTLAQISPLDSDIDNFFMRYFVFKQYEDTLDMKTLRSLFGNANNIFKETFLDAHINPVLEKLENITSAENIDSVVCEFLGKIIYLRYYSSISEKLVNLTSADRKLLVYYLIDMGVFECSEIAKAVKVSDATVYRYLRERKGIG